LTRSHLTWVGLIKNLTNYSGFISKIEKDDKSTWNLQWHLKNVISKDVI
jgi:hypothetical protein